MGFARGQGDGIEIEIKRYFWYMVFLAYFLVLYEPRWKTKEMGAYARFARRLRVRKTMIVLQLLLYCLLFTAMVKIAVIGDSYGLLYFLSK